MTPELAREYLKKTYERIMKNNYTFSFLEFKNKITFKTEEVWLSKKKELLTQGKAEELQKLEDELPEVSGKILFIEGNKEAFKIFFYDSKIKKIYYLKFVYIKLTDYYSFEVTEEISEAAIFKIITLKGFPIIKCVLAMTYIEGDLKPINNIPNDLLYFNSAKLELTGDINLAISQTKDNFYFFLNDPETISAIQEIQMNNLLKNVAIYGGIGLVVLIIVLLLTRGNNDNNNNNNNYDDDYY